MTVRELVNFLSTLSESDKDKEICFSLNTVPSISEVYTPKRGNSSSIGKYDVTIYIKGAWEDITR